MSVLFLIVFTLIILSILFLEAINNVPKIEMKTFGQSIIVKYIKDKAERAKISGAFRSFDKKWHPWSAVRLGFLPMLLGIMVAGLMFEEKTFEDYFWLVVWAFFYVGILATGVFQFFINILWDKVDTWHIDTTSWVNTKVLPKTIWMYWAYQIVFLIIILGIYPALKIIQ